LKNFAWYRQQCDTPPVIAVDQVTFGSGIIILFFQSDCTILLSHMALHSFVNSGIIAFEYFKSSGRIWSIPTVFPFFNLLTAFITMSHSLTAFSIVQTL